MVIENLSQTSVISALKKQVDMIESKRINERYTMINYYEGMASEMEGDIKEYFNSDSLKQVPHLTQNITGKLINSRAIVYKEAPQREVDERLFEFTNTLDSSMLQFERMTYLLGTCGMLVKWDEESENDKLNYDMLIEFYPLFFETDSKPVAVIYPLFNHEKTKVTESTYAYWSDEEHYLITQGGGKVSVNDDDSNPFGKIPIVFAHRHPMTTEWWREGASDIVTMNQTINVMLTEMSLSMRLQMLGQPVITGVDEETRLAMGVDKPILLPEGSGFSFASAGGDLQKYVEGMRFLVDSVAYNNNLKTKWSQGRDAAISGEALKLMEIDLTESVMADAEHIWRPVENERFEIERAILEANGVTLSEEYSVDFSEPRFPLSASEERLQWDWEFDHGFKTKKDYIRHTNPDASEEQIEEILSQISEQRKVEKEEEAPEQQEQQAPLFNLRTLTNGSKVSRQVS